MRNIQILTTLLLLLGIAAPVSADVLDFDDVVSGGFVESTGCSGRCYVIADGYGGLNWDETYVLDTARYGENGYTNGVQSGEFVAFNGFARTSSTNGAAFDFNGAYFGAAWNDGLQITISGYFEGDLAYSETITANTTGSVYHELDFLGVDQLVFSSAGGVSAGFGGVGTHFAMDDFTFNESPQKVPELSAGSAPASIALVVGVLLLIADRRKHFLV